MRHNEIKARAKRQLDAITDRRFKQIALQALLRGTARRAAKKAVAA